MKKLLITAIAAGWGLAAFGQGTIIFENYDNSSANIYLYPPGVAPVGDPGFAVSLLWYNGTSFQLAATYQTTGSDVPGTFYDPVTVDIPTYSATGTFEVEAWYNPHENIASFAAAADNTRNHRWDNGIVHCA